MSCQPTVHSDEWAGGLAILPVFYLQDFMNEESNMNETSEQLHAIKARIEASRAICEASAVAQGNKVGRWWVANEATHDQLVRLNASANDNYPETLDELNDLIFGRHRIDDMNELGFWSDLADANQIDLEEVGGPHFVNGFFSGALELYELAMNAITVGNKPGMEQIKERLSSDKAEADMPEESSGRHYGKQWAAKLEAPDALERLMAFEGWPINLEELAAIVEAGAEMKVGCRELLGIPVNHDQDWFDSEGFIKGFVIGALDTFDEHTDL